MTKTCGDSCLDKPRFSMFSFTQNFYISKFAEGNCENGFLQRFILSIPEEKGVYIFDKKQLLKSERKVLNMASVLSNVYKRCFEASIFLKLVDGAIKLYEEYHDEVVSFRLDKKNHRFMKSVKSKSLGMALRLSGVMSLLRNSLKYVDCDEVPKFDDTVIYDDFKRALNVVNFSVETCIGLLKPKIKVENAKMNHRITKEPVPEPENCTMDYLIANARIVKRVLNKDEISISSITRDKIYPVSGNDTGAHIARKFLNGMVNLGLGVLKDNGKVFQRYHFDDEDCPDKEELENKWKKLQLI